MIRRAKSMRGAFLSKDGSVAAEDGDAATASASPSSGKSSTMKKKGGTTKEMDPTARMKRLEKQHSALQGEIRKYTKKCGEDHGSKEDARNEARLAQLEQAEKQVVQEMREVRAIMLEHGLAGEGLARKPTKRRVGLAATMSRAAHGGSKHNKNTDKDNDKGTDKDIFGSGGSGGGSSSTDFARGSLSRAMGSLGRSPSPSASKKRAGLTGDLRSSGGSGNNSPNLPTNRLKGGHKDNSSSSPSRVRKNSAGSSDLNGKDSIGSSGTSVGKHGSQGSLDNLSSLVTDLDSGEFRLPAASRKPSGHKSVPDTFVTVGEDTSGSLAAALADLDVSGLDEMEPVDDGSSRSLIGTDRRPFPTGPIDFSSENFVCNVVREYANAEDMNLSGLQRAKKGKRANFGANATGKMVYQMEDQHVCLCPVAHNIQFGQSGLFCVMDGHIDKNCAAAAKQLLPLHFVAQLSAATKANDNVIPDNLEDAFLNAFKMCDNDLKRFEFEGCTATAVYIWRRDNRRFVQCANVGDSSAFMYRRKRTEKFAESASSGSAASDDGDESDTIASEAEYEAVMLSFDHKVGCPEERSRLKEMGVALNENQTRLNGLAVARSLGDHFAKENNTGVVGIPYVSPVYEITNAEDGLIIVIASDGLWDVLSGKRACEVAVAERGFTAEMQAEKLLKTALASSKNHDNVTITCVQLV